jgi:hypothetical protein
MRRLAEGHAVGVDGISRVLPLVVGIRPLGGIGLADRVVEDVVGILLARAIARILARWLGEPGGRLGFRVIFHKASFPLACGI